MSALDDTTHSDAGEERQVENDGPVHIFEDADVLDGYVSSSLVFDSEPDQRPSTKRPLDEIVDDRSSLPPAKSRMRNRKNSARSRLGEKSQSTLLISVADSDSDFSSIEEDELFDPDAVWVPQFVEEIYPDNLLEDPFWRVETLKESTKRLGTYDQRRMDFVLPPSSRKMLTETTLGDENAAPVRRQETEDEYNARRCTEFKTSTQIEEIPDSQPDPFGSSLESDEDGGVGVRSAGEMTMLDEWDLRYLIKPVAETQILTGKNGV